MSKTNSNKALLSTGIIAAIASSLCCIVPAIAAIASISGTAASVSWMEPARPYLLGFTVLVLGFAWYQKLKPVKVEADDCGCEVNPKSSFWQSKTFLGIITVFAILMMTFPYYGDVFTPEVKSSVTHVEEHNVAKAEFAITGMTCGSCETHVNNALLKSEGVIKAHSSYDDGTAIAEFDKSLTNVDQLVRAIEKETGYTVTHNKLLAP